MEKQSRTAEFKPSLRNRGSCGHASPYRLRKILPEPVFGQIKRARGFRQFLLRGFEKVCGEWAIVCTAHNLLKLAQGGVCPQRRRWLLEQDKGRDKVELKLNCGDYDPQTHHQPSTASPQ